MHKREPASLVAQGWDSWLPASKPVSLCVCRSSEPAHMSHSARISVPGPPHLPPYTNMLFLVTAHPLHPYRTSGSLLLQERRRDPFTPGSWLTVTHTDHLGRHTHLDTGSHTEIHTHTRKEHFPISGTRTWETQQAGCKVVARLGEGRGAGGWLEASEPCILGAPAPGSGVAAQGIKGLRGIRTFRARSQGGNTALWASPDTKWEDGAGASASEHPRLPHHLAGPHLGPLLQGATLPALGSCSPSCAGDLREVALATQCLPAFLAGLAALSCPHPPPFTPAAELWL